MTTKDGWPSVFQRSQFKRFAERWVRRTRIALLEIQCEAEYVPRRRGPDRQKRRRRVSFSSPGRRVPLIRSPMVPVPTEAERKAARLVQLAEWAVKREAQARAKAERKARNEVTVRSMNAPCLSANEAARDFCDLEEVTREPPDYAAHVPIQNLLDLTPVDPLWDGMLPTPDGWGNMARWRRQLHSSKGHRDARGKPDLGAADGT